MNQDPRRDRRAARPARPSESRSGRPSGRVWSALIAGLVGVIALVVPNLGRSTDATSGRSTTTTLRTATTTLRTTNTLRTPAGADVSRTRSNPALRAIGFRSSQKLSDHYTKHGREFGSITKSQYLSMAQDLRDARLSNTVIETTQKGGTISRFDRASGAFLAFDRDLTIRTFFKPDAGEDYFWRAANLTH